MRRDLTKAIAEGQKLIEKNRKLDLDGVETIDLLHEALRDEGFLSNNVFEVIGKAYLAGLAIGTRNAKKGA